MQNFIKLSIIVPVLNEAANLPEFHGRMVATLRRLNLSAEIIYLDDSSIDKSVEIIEGY